jgi:hypothetical protein
MLVLPRLVDALFFPLARVESLMIMITIQKVRDRIKRKDMLAEM